MNENYVEVLTSSMPSSINYELYGIEELKNTRKQLDISRISPMLHPESKVIAYLIRTIDILLERVEKLEGELNGR